MKRLIIFAAAAAVTALALTGGASAKTFRMSEHARELCLLLKSADEISCTQYEKKLSNRRAWAEFTRGVRREVTGSPIDETGGLPPQSLTQ